MITDTSTAGAATAPDTTETLPPYSGDDTQCAMCSHTTAFTFYRAERARIMREFNGRVERYATFTARLERQCGRCDYQWDEALNPPPGPEPTRPASAADLVHALDVACHGYAVDLHPQLAEHMAGILLELLLVDVRTEHPAWTKAAPAARPPLAVPADIPAAPDPALTSPVPIPVTAPQDRPQAPPEPRPAPATFGAPVPLHDKTEDDA